jgi:hypothetical protein
MIPHGVNSGWNQMELSSHELFDFVFSLSLSSNCWIIWWSSQTVHHVMQVISTNPRTRISLTNTVSGITLLLLSYARQIPLSLGSFSKACFVVLTLHPLTGLPGCVNYNHPPTHPVLAPLPLSCSLAAVTSHSTLYSYPEYP